MPGTVAPPVRRARSTSPRILIINPFGIGDVLFSTPLVRAVRQAFPKSRLGYVGNRRTESILRTNTWLDEVFIYEKDELVQLWRTDRVRCLARVGDLLRRVRGARFDLAIDLSLGERYGFLLKWLGVRRRFGFNYRRRGRFLTEALPIDGYHDRHVVEYYCQLLSWMGIRLDQAALELPIAEADRRWADEWIRAHQVDAGRPLVGIVPAGGVSWGIDAPFRRWSCEGFAAVGDALAQRHGARILLFGETADSTTCRTVARLMRSPVIDVSGQTTLGQFVSLLGRLALVICNDGGPLHLAVTQGVKTVSIFGPVDPKVYGPYPPSDRRHWVVCQAHLPCRPCYHNFRLPPCPYERACLTTISPAEVIEACEGLLPKSSNSMHVPLS